MKVGHIIMMVMMAVFAGVGIMLLWSGISSLKKSIDAEDWPTTYAEVQRVELTEDSDSDGTTYKVEVEYSYQVGGQAYSGNIISSGYSGSSGQEPHLQVYEKIKSAKVVEIRYNPKVPEESAIAYGVTRSNLIHMAFAVTWSLFVAGFISILLAFQGGDERLLSRIKIIEYAKASTVSR
ncbi:DUF3592 domain-containing protein [Aquipseudomonas alcaligenes]|uniref:DUF3592 domain-containing protein n=1 Tax=Aquipseudomonas alcaligenes TaxID=43263 RepID=UPI0037493DD6